jgi:hypothetical protein
MHHVCANTAGLHAPAVVGLDGCRCGTMHYYMLQPPSPSAGGSDARPLRRDSHDPNAVV